MARLSYIPSPDADPWNPDTPPAAPLQYGVINSNLPAAEPIPAETGGGRGRFGGGPGIDYGNLGGRPSFNFGPVPQFVPPEFQRPTVDAAFNEPGYRFRLKSGSDALERSAAAKGTLRTGGTLKDILEYGQNFGAQEYNNVFNRELGAFDRQYQGAKDRFAPQLAQYQLQGQAEMAAALAQYQRSFDLYSFNNRGNGGGAPLIPPPPNAPDVSAFSSLLDPNMGFY